MSDDLDALPQSDQIEGAPHPRETLELIGQQVAEDQFLKSYAAGRLHHGWLITGPRGIGKATFCYRLARFLLSEPTDQDSGLFGDAPPAPTSLEIAPDHPVHRHILAQSEPRLFVLRPSYDLEKKQMRQVIRVDEIREMSKFFHLSATDGGRRVVIIDSADDMNVSSANALLKHLEEPPKNVILLLISHQPSRLLSTIRSRCRELRLSPLKSDTIEQVLAQAGVEAHGQTDGLADLAAGSAGEAIRILNLGGLEVYNKLLSLAASLPNLDRNAATQFADSFTGRAKTDQLDLLIDLLDIFFARLARSGVLGEAFQSTIPKEKDIFSRLCPSPQNARKWADLAQETLGQIRHGRAVNLDAAPLILDTLWKMEQTAAR